MAEYIYIIHVVQQKITDMPNKHSYIHYPVNGWLYV